MDRLLYWHDLEPAPEGAQHLTIPPELGDEIGRRVEAFVMDRREDFPALEVVAFRARGPRPSDRYAIALRLDDLHGSVEDNVDSIRRTAPDGWEVTARMGTL